MKRILLIALLVGCVATIGNLPVALAHDHHVQPKRPIAHSKQTGDWSNPATWSTGKCPGEGDVVQIKAGHEVRYDVDSATPIRGVHVAGRLSFATDRDTRLVVGLLRVQPGDDCTEEGFDCTIHVDDASATGHHTKLHAGKGAQSDRPELLVGTPDQPIGAGHTARIQLAYFEGMNKESLPAVVCCGGRMELHGQPLDRTWLKLGQTAKAGDREVVLEQAAGGWRIGDRVILVATNFPRLTRENPNRNDPKLYREAFINTVREATQTEERIIEAIDGNRLTLDKPLEFEHRAEDAYRGEVANLSRNVVVESLDPAGERGHTMYHAYSAGSIG